MKRTSFADWPCSVARTIDVLGDWWTPLILRNAFYGVRRFEEFQRSLGISRNLLTQRLAHLTDQGMLTRVQYSARPPRFEYRLTQKGREFFPVVLALLHWGDQWMGDGSGDVPVLLRHTPCGHVMHAQTVCSECHRVLEARDVVAEPGPGFPAERTLGRAGIVRAAPRTDAFGEGMPALTPGPAGTQ
jgi:DNA-binding HxlR family transcriptional regulator